MIQTPLSSIWNECNSSKWRANYSLPIPPPPLADVTTVSFAHCVGARTSLICTAILPPPGNIDTLPTADCITRQQLFCLLQAGTGLQLITPQHISPKHAYISAPAALIKIRLLVLTKSSAWLSLQLQCIWSSVGFPFVVVWHSAWHRDVAGHPLLNPQHTSFPLLLFTSSCSSTDDSTSRCQCAALRFNYDFSFKIENLTVLNTRRERNLKSIHFPSWVMPQGTVPHMHMHVLHRKFIDSIGLLLIVEYRYLSTPWRDELEL